MLRRAVTCATQVAALQSALDRSQAAEANLTARLDELSGQLADSGVEGGSLRAQNGELLAELAALRWVLTFEAGTGGGGSECALHKVSW